MNIKTKQHAKDYLLEYEAKKNTPNWLAYLIQKVIDTNGKIYDDDKNLVFQELLKENDINIDQNIAQVKSEDILALNEIEPNTPVQKLTLQKITHIKGVNALMPNQVIIFSPACTVIYGLNGTGKSGYFRIIHELAGGFKSKDILDNIYKKGDGLEVNVDFLLNDNVQNYYKWQDKKVRGVFPFNQLKVFDSEYLPFFLNERESSVNIEPFGLNLFKVITTIIDEFKERLGQTIRQLEKQKPELLALNEIIHSDKLRLLLQKRSLSEQEKKQIDDNRTFSSDETTKLAQLKKAKSSLEKNNVEDQIKVFVQEKVEIDNLKNHLSNLKVKLEELTKFSSATIADYLEKKRKRDEQVKQFEILKNIPAQDSEEWHIFIESAEEYGAIINLQALNKDKKCIYCHQQLSEEAVTLIKSYAQYLGDQSQKNLKNAVDKAIELKKEIYDLKVDFIISENLENILAEIENEQKQDPVKLIKQILTEAENQKTLLVKSLKDKTIESEIFTLDLFKSNEILEGFLTEYQDKINNLQQTDAEKVRKILLLEEEINRLEDKSNISKWIEKIETYFSICQSIQKYSSVVQAISTKSITELGSKAHDELLSDSIKKSFEDELKALGKDIEVSLKKTGAGKGTVRTQLKVLGNDVRFILSDGEQKAVALALFLAEVENQHNKCPIIFDDPVTSVDHEVADFLSQRLLQLSVNRQIIIFTHNRHFYDSILYWGNSLKDDEDNKTHHICKNYTKKGCNGKGCHVYTYRIDREAKDKIGRIFEAQNESCIYYIEKAVNEIKGDYSLSCVSGYLKSAIEHYIDEIILLNTVLLKNRRRRINIPWENLKKIGSKKDVVMQLELYWEDLSNRGTHATQNSKLNPLNTEDLNNIIVYLKSQYYS